MLVVISNDCFFVKMGDERDLLAFGDVSKFYWHKFWMMLSIV